MRSKNILAFLIVFFASGMQLRAETPAGGFRSPEGDQRLTAKAGAKPLNNLVFELLNKKSPGNGKHEFQNPREGWVYICVPASPKQQMKPPVFILDGKEVQSKLVGKNYESMRYVDQGLHTISIDQGAEDIDHLEVRAIGELVYASYGDNPHIPENGNYTWEFLKQHCLDSYNSMIGSSAVTSDGQSTQEAEIKEWTNEGKRWFTLHSAPTQDRAGVEAKTADEAYDYWTNTLGMKHPLMSGIWADEFGPKMASYYPAWCEALQRIHANPKFNGRKFCAYCSNRFWPLSDGYEGMFPFVKTLVDCDYRLGPEWYQVEGKSRPGRIIAKTSDLRAELGPEWEQNTRESFEKAYPGAATDRIVILSLLSEPGYETGDLYPNYDFNVLLDYEFHFLANEPAFFGIRGVQGYLSSYCSEEQLRLFAKLVRHYAIEGRTDLMLKDPYVLPHLQNADFEDGTKAWSLSPAEPTSIAAKTAKGFGILEAKYHGPDGLGDKVLWTKRSPAKPNVISQEIRDLVSGRFYSLHFITGDYQELLSGKSKNRKHAVSVKLDNVDLQADKCFQAVVGAGCYYPFGGFTRENPYWLNYHQLIFRAKDRTSRLTISDWSTKEKAGGPENEELIWNFVQLQPYFE